MSRRILAWIALAAATLLLAAAPRQRPSSPKASSFAPDLIEHFLSDDQIAFIRPGLKIKINSVTIPADRRPVVDAILTDGSDQPIDRLGKVTPGVVTLGFVLGWYNPDTRQYVNYRVITATAPANSPNPGAKATQAAADAGGTFTDLDLGHLTYRFGTVLPSNFDATKTHTLAIYGNRNLQDLLGKTYLADIESDFRPDGQPVTQTWDKINVATSCNNCHDPLSAHGTTGRMNPKTCALCHQPQSTDPDTGNTVDFKVMIHKIHMGAQLPSVQAGNPYQIIGFGQAVNDFSTVVFPQDIRNCANCHEGTNASAKPSQFFVWYTYPSRAACGSCHDNIDWTTGANHPAGPQADDSACATCHTPDSGHEFDASIKGGHTIETKSS
ncbi:MAG TPA: OmcA/MtrC family decaheme c-type cytochrome, partial [Thermoanaerobaculia bacterium]|nr:OmcA/MtrC family decaheme c-type cytochrome [Thermoanaerobaculia bacterium]